MSQPPNPTIEELRDIANQAHAWIDNLVIAGVHEQAVIAGINQALIERQLTSGGVDATIAWLRLGASRVEQMGPAMLAELRKQGH